MSLTLDIKYRLLTRTLSIQCEFPSDGISGIFGPSGVGKTSLLRLVSGLDQPSSGNIRFKDQAWFSDSKTMSPRQRRVGFVFQDSRLFPHLNVERNLSLVQQQVVNPTHDLAQLCADFEISDLLPQRANKLSAGQQQRVAIVRSLLAQPQLLLLDEPLAALDESNKHTMLTQLKIHSEKYQLPMIYVSHNANEIAQFCDSLLLLNHDNSIEFGDSQLLLQQHLQQKTTVVTTDDQQHLITLSLTPQQYQRYRNKLHLFISKV